MIAAAIGLILAMSKAVQASENIKEYEMIGINLPMPEALEETAGLLLPYPTGSMDDDHHIYGCYYDAIREKM